MKQSERGAGLTARILRRVYRTSAFSAIPLIVLGFAAIILLGSLLLALPAASASGRSVGWFDALFTAVSAVCVTGLVVVDTGTAYSTFGHVVLLMLIQLGGLGFMTFATLLFRLMGRQASLRERMILRESMNSEDGGIVRLVQWVALSAFTVELLGAGLFSLRFIPMYGPGRGVFYAVFHAVSAFCNAGFDLFGGGKSLTDFVGDGLVNATAILLVVVGGLGFGVLNDLLRGFHRRRLRLHTRLVLASYGILFAAGFIVNLALEWSNPGTLGPLTFGGKTLAALFQTMTLRTAGFNTISQIDLRDSTKLVNCLLMLIGAAPASTGGGVKVTTMAILWLTVRMIVRGEDDLNVFGRRLDRGLIQRALAIVFIAIAVVFADVCALSLLQPEEAFLDVLYECTSAMGTVGISAFGSAKLVPLSRVLIMLTMFAGRVGPMTLALLFARRQVRSRPLVRYPEEHVLIG